MNTYHPSLVALILLILGLVSLIIAFFFHRQKIGSGKRLKEKIRQEQLFTALTSWFTMAGIVFLLATLFSIFKDFIF